MRAVRLRPGSRLPDSISGSIQKILNAVAGISISRKAGILKVLQIFIVGSCGCRRYKDGLNGKEAGWTPGGAL